MTKKDFDKLKVGSVMHFNDHIGQNQILVVREVKRGKLLVKWDKWDHISVFSKDGGVDSFIIASDPTPTSLQWVDEICKVYADAVRIKTELIRGGE